MLFDASDGRVYARYAEQSQEDRAFQSERRCMLASQFTASELLRYSSKIAEGMPVTFEGYLLAPGWYAPERRSKRFVTTVLRSSVLITDLVPRWRSAWRGLLRAKLWCELWSANK